MRTEITSVVAMIYSNHYIFLGLDAAEEKDYNNGILYFMKAVQISPNSFEAWNNLAITYYETDQIEKATIAWKKALEIKEDSQIRKNLAIIKKNGN